MKAIIHRAKSRGFFDYDWLKTYHTFSFGEYFSPKRVHFGALRVLNDDTVGPGKGFGAHSHHDMEIISIPLEGTLEHRDSTGHQQAIGPGMIQVISAGTGIRHSEYNKNPDAPVKFLQIWILPDRHRVEPRYESLRIDGLLKPNRISEIVKPYPGDGDGLWIHQRAWLSIAMLEEGKEASYSCESKESYGVYLFVIRGGIAVNGEIELQARDGMGVTEASSFRIRALTDNTEVLLMEVPPLK